MRNAKNDGHVTCVTLSLFIVTCSYLTVILHVFNYYRVHSYLSFTLSKVYCIHHHQKKAYVYKENCVGDCRLNPQARSWEVMKGCEPSQIIPSTLLHNSCRYPLRSLSHNARSVQPQETGALRRRKSPSCCIFIATTYCTEKVVGAKERCCAFHPASPC